MNRPRRKNPEPMCYKNHLCSDGFKLQNAVREADEACTLAGAMGADDDTIDTLAIACEAAASRLHDHWAVKCRGKGHVMGCTRASPLCKHRKSQVNACSCDAYHFPHRTGSRACKLGVPASLLATMSAEQIANMGDAPGAAPF